MEKNVTVIDEDGNVIGTTYAKRANGLIKKGRARRVDDDTVCLARQPNGNTEDVIMNNNSQEKLSPKEIFRQLVSLQKQLTGDAMQKALTDAVCAVACDESAEGGHDQMVSDVTDVFKSREDNIMKLLTIYEKMYADCSKKVN